MAKTRPSVLELALNVLGYTLKDKPVILYTEDGEEVLADASIISCRVDDQSKLMEHPIESGAKISDHKVFEPRSIDMTIAFTADGYAEEYRQLFNLYRDCTIMKLQTKAQVYNNLQIESIPHEEKVETMNRMIFNIKLKEAIVVTAQFVKATIVKAKKAPDKPTEEVGQKPPVNESALYGAVGGKEGAERIAQATKEGGFFAGLKQGVTEVSNVISNKINNIKANQANAGAANG